MNRLLVEDLADNEPLMVALGKIVLRSAELGEAVDRVISQLDPANGRQSRGLMLGRKLDLLKETATAVLSAAPELRNQLILFCDGTLSSIEQLRNSPVHSTFLASDVEGLVIKCDIKSGLDLISIDNLNKGAEKLKSKTKRLQYFFLHEIQNFQALRTT